MRLRTIQITAILVFWIGAYYGGNWFLGNFDKPLVDQIMATLCGVMFWIVLVGPTVAIWFEIQGLLK